MITDGAFALSVFGSGITWERWAEEPRMGPKQQIEVRLDVGKSTRRTMENPHNARRRSLRESLWNPEGGTQLPLPPGLLRMQSQTGGCWAII